MAVPPIPTPLDDLGERPFSFYPPILNIERNEWILRRSTWSEILVSNTTDAQEIWVPRRFLGEVSAIDEPVVIVGLTKELEYTAGQIMPHSRRVLEMPAAPGANSTPPPDESIAPRPAGAVRAPMENRAESRMSRLIVGALVGGIVLCVLLIAVFRSARDGSRISYRAVEQSELGLSAEDDYYAVVRKLGPPARERWRSGEGEIQYQILEYPDRGLSAILMGTEKGKTHYIGSLDRNWRVIHSIPLHGGDSAGLLRSLKRF